jgi:hypothetical protein
MSSKYKLNKNIFETITKESAWVLGWILADGCIYNNRLSIALNSKDEEVVYKLKNIINYTGPVRRILCNKSWTSGFSIYNTKLITDLSNYGAIPKKSLILSYPKLIGWNNMRHFVRGFFEGDGCVKYNKKRNCVCINFKGTLEFLNRLRRNLKNCLGINGCIVKTKNTKENVYDYYISGNKISILFLNWIYDGSEECTRLNRKYERSKELYNLMLNNRKTSIEAILTI